MHKLDDFQRSQRETDRADYTDYDFFVLDQKGYDVRYRIKKVLDVSDNGIHVDACRCVQNRLQNAVYALLHSCKHRLHALRKLCCLFREFKLRVVGVYDILVVAVPCVADLAEALIGHSLQDEVCPVRLRFGVLQSEIEEIFGTGGFLHRLVPLFVFLGVFLEHHAEGLALFAAPVQDVGKGARHLPGADRLVHRFRKTVDRDTVSVFRPSADCARNQAVYVLLRCTDCLQIRRRRGSGLIVPKRPVKLIKRFACLLRGVSRRLAGGFQRAHDLAVFFRLLVQVLKPGGDPLDSLDEYIGFEVIGEAGRTVSRLFERVVCALGRIFYVLNRLLVDLLDL